MKGKAIIGITILSVVASLAVSEAVGPGEGQMTKSNVPVSQDGCIADSLTVKWNLDSFFGEPTVNGTYKYSGDCKPSSDFVMASGGIQQRLGLRTAFSCNTEQSWRMRFQRNRIA